MKHASLRLGVLTVPALLALALPGDQVGYHPAEGLSLTRTYTSKTELTLDDMEISQNGQPVQMPMEIDMDMSMSQKTVVTDKYGAFGEARPKKLTRSFDELAQQSDFSMRMQGGPGGDQDKSVESASDLQGKTVVFTWDEDSGAYKAAFSTDEGDAKLLEGLEEDMDLEALLPVKEVAEGDTWDLDVKKLRPLLAYGGNLHLKPTDEEGASSAMPGMDSMGDFSSVFGDMLEGEASAEYRGSRDVDGTKCAVIHLTLDVSASADISDKVRDAMENLPNDQVRSLEIEHMDLELEMKGEGDLYWDLEAGVPHSLELTGTTNMTMDMAMNIDIGGGSPLSMEQNLQLSGSFTNALKVAKN